MSSNDKTAAPSVDAKPTADQKLDDLVKQHGECVLKLEPEEIDAQVHPLARTPVYLRRMKRPEYQRFLSTIARDQGKMPQAQERLLQACLLHPTWPELTAIYDVAPGLESAHFGALQAASGITADFGSRGASPRG